METKWHKVPKVYLGVEKADEEEVLILDGLGLDSKVENVLKKMVEMIKLHANQTNEHYLDLSKR